MGGSFVVAIMKLEERGSLSPWRPVSVFLAKGEARLFWLIKKPFGSERQKEDVSFVLMAELERKDDYIYESYSILFLSYEIV